MSNEVMGNLKDAVAQDSMVTELGQDRCLAVVGGGQERVKVNTRLKDVAELFEDDLSVGPWIFGDGRGQRLVWVVQPTQPAVVDLEAGGNEVTLGDGEGQSKPKHLHRP